MRRRLVLLVCGVLLVLLGCSGWACTRAFQARRDLTAAQAMVASIQADLREGRIDAAVAALPAVRAHLDRAATHVHGPSWVVALRVPLLGANLHAVRRAARAGQIVGAGALPPLVHALDVVRRERPLRDGAVDLVVLRGLAVDLHAAASASGRARAALATRDAWLAPVVSSKLDEARDRINGLDDALQAAARALDIAPAMLGDEGPRRYFVQVQNNAEARATGGLIGAFALVRTDHGRIQLERTGTDAELDIFSEPVPSPPGAARSWQELGSTRAWFDANLTPHFPDAAQNMAGLWARQTGQRVDGVLALDPVVMSELLKAAAPIRLKDGSRITADNVVDFVGRREYFDYPDVAARKALLAELASDLFHAVVAAGDSTASLRGLIKAGGSGHLFLWSRHPEEQKALTQSIVGGALPATDTPYLMLLTQNYGGNKLDFYLRRRITVNRQRDGVLNVTVVLHNAAPLALPLYMTVRSDEPVPTVPYGQARVGLSVYGALSSQLGGITVDGAPELVEYDRDHGHPFGSVTVEVPRDRDVVVRLTLTEPKGILVYRQQPLLRPDDLAIEVAHRTVGS